MLTTIDSFSKWAIASPMPDQTANSVTQSFIKMVITKVGIPHIVVTDNGRQFLSQIFKDLSHIYNFEHRTTTPYHPEGNGAVERLHRTLTAMLSAYVGDKERDWTLYLDVVIYAYNCSIQASTNQTPFYVIYGREPVLPLDLSLGLGPKTQQSLTLPSYLNTHTLELKQIWKEVYENLLASQQIQKAYHDNKAKEKPVEKEELVMMCIEAIKDKKKLGKRWEGPYRVLKIRRPNITIRSLLNSKIIQTHVNKVKRFWAQQPSH